MWRRLRDWYASFAMVWLNACLLFLLVNAGLAVIHGRTKPPVLQPIRSTIARAHPDLDAGAIDELVAESDRPIAYEPYTDMTDPPVRGRFVNIDDAGFRRSTDQGPWPPDPRHYNVFLFGGSTTFGYGVADADTIASYLQPMLHDVGDRAARVYNFGHSGYYSTQERILFERFVVAGHAPDAAVFVDGLNEFGTIGDVPLTAGRIERAYRSLDEPPLRTALSLLPMNTTARHLGRVLGLVPPDPEVRDDPPRFDDEAVLRATLDRYRRTKAVIASIGAARDVRTLFVWQPVPTYEFPPGDAQRWAGGGVLGWARHSYPRMAVSLRAGELGDDFVWCADLATDGTEAFYVDRVHYAPLLAQRLARCIADGFEKSAPARAKE